MNNHILNKTFSTSSLAKYKSILEVLSLRDLDKSKDVFNKLNATEIKDFHAFRKAFSQLSQAEKLTFLTQEFVSETC